jgi:hypothetical protein
MTFGELKRLLRIGVDRDDLADLYGDFVNRAAHDMQVDANWNAMRNLNTITLTAGDLTATMPENFKSVTKLKTPISLVRSDGTTAPCEIYSREEIDRLRLSFGALAESTTGRDRKLSVFLDCQDGLWVVGIPTAVDEDLTFRISYFGFLRDMVEDEDSNLLSQNYPDVILERAKMLAFRAVNDPEWKEHAESYIGELQRASRVDSAILAASRKDRA